MTNRTLITFLLARRARGFSTEQTRLEATAAGWITEDLDAAELEIKRLIDSPTAPIAPKQRHRLSPADALLFLGGLIVLAGAVLLIAPSWSGWNWFWRIITVIVPTVVLLIAGHRIWTNQNNSHPAFLFLVVGGLLLPVAIGVVIWEIVSVPGNEAPMFLMTSILTGGYYAFAAWRYRHLLWTALACVATLGIFFSTVAWLGVTEPRSWLWFGTLYGVLLYSAGLLLERNAKVFEARSPYFFGAGAFVISTGTLGLSGLLLSRGSIYDSGLQSTAQAGSILIVAILFLLVSLLGRYWQRRQLREASIYNRAWDFLGALGVCLAPLLVGLDDAYKNVSLLAVLVAIGVMGAAVYWQQRFWFYAAAIVFVMALVRIGTGLFPDSAVWPVMLLVVGPLIMGTGYTLLKIQSRLFQGAKKQPLG